MNKQSKNKQPLIDDEGEVRELTAADFNDMRSASEIVPEVIEAYKQTRGRPQMENPKISTTIRLDAEVLSYFRATGKGWQTRINEALQEYVTAHSDS